MKVSRFYPSTIWIDDPETGENKEIRIKVKRFSVEEGAAFSRNYHRSANPPSAAMVARKDTPEEQAKDEKGVYKLSDEEIKARRLLEMDEETRRQYDEMDEDEEAFSRTFLVETITNYIRVEPEQIFEETDGGEWKSVVDGAGLLRLFGGRQDILFQLLRAVRQENTLSAAAKKVLKSLSDSARSSVAQRMAAVGQKPEPTADAAETAASAGTEVASAGRETSPSGSAA